MNLKTFILHDKMYKVCLNTKQVSDAEAFITINKFYYIKKLQKTLPRFSYFPSLHFFSSSSKSHIRIICARTISLLLFY